MRSPLTKLINRSRRNWIATRAAEGAAIGLLVAAAVGLAWIALAAYFGERSIELVLIWCGAGALCGAAGSLWWIPNRLDVATRLDRRFNLHDLLSTALAPAAGQDRDIRQLILAQADSAAEGLPRSGLMFNRMGRRGYFASALSLGLVTTLAALAAPQRDAGDASESVDTAASINLHPSRSVESRAAITGDGKVRKQLDQQPGEPAQASRSVAEVESSSSARSAVGDAIDSRETISSAGTAAEQSFTAAARLIPDANAATPAGDLSAGGGRDGEPGEADVQPGVPAGRSAVRAESTSDARPGAKPSVPARPPDIPPAYRDLVRAYFARD